jgi:putative aldouronate transport system substrate-binding protein
MKRFGPVLMLLLTFAAAVLPASGSREGTEATIPGGSASTQDAQSAREGYALPLAQPDSVTLKYMVAENTSGLPSRTSGLPVIKEIMRLTGVNLKIEAIPQSSYQKVVATRLAANTDLPDVVRMPGSHYEFGADGALVNLTPYIKKYNTYMERYFSFEPESQPYFISPDGNYYGWYPVKSGTDLADPYGWIIRKDWLDNLGLKTPRTADEWYDVLVAFKKNDPNKNGKNDEVPWCNPGLEGQTVWGHVWGLMMVRSEGWSVNKSGKVELDWIKPEAKEMFTWLNKLYREGLLDPEFLSMDTSAHNARFSRNVVGAFSRFANTVDSRAILARKGGDPKAAYIGTPVPTGPGGKQGYMDSYGPADSGGGAAITSACKNPDVAFRFCDWLWGSPEGTTLLWFGIEGTHYTRNAKGEPVYGDFLLKNPDGYNSTTALQAIGGHEFFPAIRSIKGPWGGWAKAQLASLNEVTRVSAETMAPFIVTKFPPLASTSKESEELSRYWTDMSTFYTEQAVGFITGSISLSKWDGFVGRLKDMGLDKVISIKQRQYDRVNAK